MIVTVDTGGTKTLVATFNTDGQVTAKHKFPTPPEPVDYIRELSATIEMLLDSQAPTLISLAIPGITENGVVKWCGNLGWKGFDVGAELKARFDVPVIIENDANLAGLAESRALPETPRFCLYVTLSTGIGTGVIRDGQIDPWLRRSEGGHAYMEFQGQLQDWEDFASGSSIVKAYGKLASEITDPSSWDEIAERVSRGFLTLIPVLQPDVVIIGGGFGGHFEKFRAKFEEILKSYLPETFVYPQFYVAAHPEEAVIYGCYYHALDSVAT